jgi:hypothetical protein
VWRAHSLAFSDLGCSGAILTRRPKRLGGDLARPADQSTAGIITPKNHSLSRRSYTVLPMAMTTAGLAPAILILLIFLPLPVIPS